MEPYIICIAGIPASGKTRYGRHLAGRLGIPFLSKDAIKETLYDRFQYDLTRREVTTEYGAASYDLLWHFAGLLLEAGVSCILESNFSPASALVLEPLAKRHGCRVLTVLFDAEMEVLHRRFLERDRTAERHVGLTAGHYFDDIETFRKATEPLRGFCVGERILADATDFEKLSYEELDRQVLAFVEGREPALAFGVLEESGPLRDAVGRVVAEEWGGPLLITAGRRYDSAALPGFVCTSGGKLRGFLLARFEGSECEVAVLWSGLENRGVGTRLMELAEESARSRGCSRLWLETTNDNTRAFRFYQRRGLELSAVRFDSMDEVRKWKQDVPLAGTDGIPLRHGLEFEKRLR